MDATSIEIELFLIQQLKEKKKTEKTWRVTDTSAARHFFEIVSRNKGSIALMVVFTFIQSAIVDRIERICGRENYVPDWTKSSTRDLELLLHVESASSSFDSETFECV